VAHHDQYEDFPYPPIPFLALPRRGEGKELRHEPARKILIVGCGTFEPCVVAQIHPDAELVVALDSSRASLAVLKRRLFLARLARKLPPVQILHQDLEAPFEIQGRFDYILASNVLHHLRNPAQALLRLSELLEPGGTLRLVTYPRMSRVWMRETRRYLERQGLTRKTPSLVDKARRRIGMLPSSSPIRSCFESQPEVNRAAGLVDAFFHAHELPLSPLQWKEAAEAAGLTLTAEAQTETSRSSFLDELAPELASLDRWTKLQILDDIWELCANPILWFKKDHPAKPVTLMPPAAPGPARIEIREALKRVDAIINPLGLNLATLHARLKKEVGPRVAPEDPRKILPGLALCDYELDELELELDPELLEPELRL